MSLTALDICNAALVKLGVGTIDTCGDGSREGDVATSLYTITRNALLATHPWSFAVGVSRLCRFDVPAASAFDHGFHLPGNFIKAISARDLDKRAVAFEISGGKLYSDAEWIDLAYIKRPPESEIPSYFISALVNRLAAEFCMPLTENASRSELLFKLAETELKLAKLIASQQDEPAQPGDFSMAELAQ